jgi:hypothetical protein
MNKITTVFISGVSFLLSTHVLALSQLTVPAPKPIIQQATMLVPAQILAKNEGGKKEKK